MSWLDYEPVLRLYLQRVVCTVNVDNGYLIKEHKNILQDIVVQFCLFSAQPFSRFRHVGSGRGT